MVGGRTGQEYRARRAAASPESRKSAPNRRIRVGGPAVLSPVTCPAPPAVLLDMDGTLTVPHLDFPAIRREIGLRSGVPILEAIDALPPDDRPAAHAVVDRHEEEAAAASELADGCHELLDYLAQRPLPYAVVTRNSRRSVETVWNRHDLPPCVCVTRDDAVHKPDPAPLRLACERLGVGDAGVWMIGDGPHDVEAGNAAGMKSVWLSLNRTERPFAAEPWRTVEDLGGVLALLRACRPLQGTT